MMHGLVAKAEDWDTADMNSVMYSSTNFLCHLMESHQFLPASVLLRVEGGYLYHLHCICVGSLSFLFLTQMKLIDNQEVPHVRASAWMIP